MVSVEVVSQKRNIEGILVNKGSNINQNNYQNNQNINSNQNQNNNMNNNNMSNNMNNNMNNISNSIHGASFDVEDPYDPLKPNDYLLWCEERLEKKRVDKLAEENKSKMAAAERARVDMERERQQAMENGDVQRLQQTMGAGRGRGRGLSNMPAWMAGYSAPSSSSAEGSGGPTGSTGQFDDSQEGTAASRIMSKMGFQQGDGLGRDGQGIVNALEHRNLGPGSGQIAMDEQDRMKIASRAIAAKLALLGGTSSGSGGPLSGSSAPSSGSSSLGGVPPTDEEKEKIPKKRLGLFSNPSCVVLLKNMVGPGEVDELLADECKQECSKYGPVSTCVIHEITTDPTCPEQECVRTFVCFEKQESAVRAYREMNGRFFGGRQIVASFYEEGKFNRRDLAPSAGEWTN